LIVGESFVYEFKTVAVLLGEHEAQLLNYLLLTNTAHGKLVNFRPSKVISRFVNAPVDKERRRTIKIVCDEFTKDAISLRTILLDLLRDWGMFLDLALYVQALTHLLGGEEDVTRMIPTARGKVPLGNQQMHPFSDYAAFRITGFKGDLSAQEHHLRRMLRLTSLKSIDWINLCREEVSLVTVH